MERFIEIIKKVMFWFLLLFISILIFISTFENGILLSFLSLIIIYLFVDKIKIKNFAFFLVLFSFITKLIAVIVLKIPLRGDYYLMYHASKAVLKGDLSFANDGYFGVFGYQLFNVFYQALILKIFKYGFTLKVLNCIYSSVITLLIYKISKKVSNEKAARISSLIYLIALYPIYLNTIYGNQQLSLMLILLGVYLALEKDNKLKYLLLAGLLIGIGNLERAEGIIYLVSLGIYLFISSSKIKIFLKKIIPVVLIYVLITTSASLIITKTNISKIGFKNANPYWKVLCGLSYEHSGKFNYDDETAFIHNKNSEIKEIKRRLTDYKTLPGLFYRKIKVQYLYDDIDQTFQVNNTKQFSGLILTIILNYIRTINILTILIAFIGQIKRKKREKWELFIIINFLLYFAAYLIIEVNARYYYNIQVDIVILASIGIAYLISLREKYKNKNS